MISYMVPQNCCVPSRWLWVIELCAILKLHDPPRRVKVQSPAQDSMNGFERRSLKHQAKVFALVNGDLNVKAGAVNSHKVVVGNNGLGLQKERGRR